MVHESEGGGDGEALQASQEECEETMSEMGARWQEEAVEEHFYRAQVVEVGLLDHLRHACGHEDLDEDRDVCHDEPKDPRTLDRKDQNQVQSLCLRRRELRPGCSGDWQQSPRSCCCCSCF